MPDDADVMVDDDQAIGVLADVDVSDRNAQGTENVNALVTKHLH